MNQKDFFALTHQGLVRQNNEDRYVVLPDLTPRGSALIIADGMGGHNKGELASFIASDYAAKCLQKEINDLMSPKEIAEVMVEIIERSNVKVYIESLSLPGNVGMGTTLTLAVLMDDLLIIAHVGDCRLYRLRDKRLELLTRDHTLSQELSMQGDISINQVNEPSRHMLTRALGVASYMHPDSYIYELNKKDRLVLCTDGLYGYLPEREIHVAMKEAESPQECAEDLIEGALSQGGGDNITVLTAFIS